VEPTIALVRRTIQQMIAVTTFAVGQTVVVLSLQQVMVIATRMQTARKA
jgi:hypothetical protein